MKTTQNILFCIALILTAAQSWASNVTIPNTFTSGTPAVASEVNANFSAVKAAVDDNDSRLSNVETNKQNRVTGTCAVGGAVTAIAADGSVTCGAFPAAGAVSVGRAAFSSMAEDAVATCAYRSYSESGHFVGTSTYICTAEAAVSLPHLATMTGLSCLVYDFLSGSPLNPRIFLRLTRTDLRNGANADIFSTSFSTDYGQQELGDTTPSSSDDAIVLNDWYAYRIRAEFTGPNNGVTTFDSISTNLRLFGCTISYQP